MKNPFKLAAWLPISARLEQAKVFARNIASRHDVPTFVQAFDEDGAPVLDDKGNIVMTPIAPDLRDVAGRWWGTKDGKSISSLILMQEFLQGTQSAITPILMGLLTVLTVLWIQLMTFGQAAAAGGSAEWVINIASALQTATLVVGGVLFFALWSAVGAKGNRMVLFFSVIIPALGLVLGSSAATALTQVAMGGDAIGQGPGLLAMLSKYALPAAGVLFVAFMFLAKRDTSKRVIMGLIYGMVFVAATAWLADKLVPNWMQPLYWTFLGCLVPVYWNHKQEKVRAARIAYQSKHGSGDIKNLGNTSAAKRLKQAQAAEKDKSGFIPLGRATGKLTQYGDGFAPDKGLQMGFTCHDLRTHIHGFGKTDGGKSFNLHTPIIQWWNIHGAGGTLVLDGKGAAGEELLASFIAKYGLKHRVLLIKPGIRLGLMEGLSPHDFIDAISDIGGAKKTEQSQSDAEKFFITQAYTLGLNIAIILRVLIDDELDRGAKRNFFWHIDSYDRLKATLKRDFDNSAIAQDDDAQADALTQEEKKSVARQILEYVDRLPAGRDPIVQDALRFLEFDFWTMPEDTAGSVVATLDTWIKPLLQHPELRPWASTEHGEDVTTPTTGGTVAVALPEVKYNIAGKLAQSLIKQRLAVKVRRRGDYDWRAAGETPVLFATDEAQELISKADRDFLPQSRGLGGYAAYFTQSYDAYESRMGDAATRAFLDNFRSLAAFESSAKTYEYLAAAMGRGKYVTWTTSGQVINFVGTAQQVAGSPLHDETHPDARFMRQLRREGAGNVIVPVGMQAGGGKQGPSAAALIMGRGYHDPDDLPSDTASGLFFTASVSSEIKERNLLTLEDCAANLNSEQDAIVSFRRAGSPRHDFVTFDTLTPEQIKEREDLFHRALLFNSLAYTLQCDLVAALGERPKGRGPMRRLTMAMIHLLLNDERFAEAYEDGLDAQLLGRVQERVEKRWKLADMEGRKAWQATVAADREAFIDRYIADMEAQKEAA